MGKEDRTMGAPDGHADPIMPDRSTPVEKLLAAYARGEHDLHDWNLAGAHLSPGAVVREEWLPEPAGPIGEEGQPPATRWASASPPTEWPVEDERRREDERRQEDEEWLPEGAETEDAEAQAAVEEWTAGMVRPQLEAEAREWERESEEEPIEAAAQPPLKEPEEAEAEAKYGI